MASNGSNPGPSNDDNLPEADRSTQREATSSPAPTSAEPSPRGATPGPSGLPVLVVGRPELVSTAETARMPATAETGGGASSGDHDSTGLGSAAAQRAMAAGAPAISSDGRYIAFVSESGDLVGGDDNGAADVFLRDVIENRTILISRAMDGGTGAGGSLQPAISADGRFVAFTSSADDLVPADSNGSLDVFVHDTRTGEISLVSRGSNGELANHDSFSPSLSADGRFVAFSSLATNLDDRDRNTSPDVYMHDRHTQRTTLVSAGANGNSGDGPSVQPSVSANGRFVAFTSTARFTVDDDNDVADVYVHDMQSGANELISKSTTGRAGNGPSHDPALSADGHSVAFTSEADNLVEGDHNHASDVFVHERTTGQTRAVSATADGHTPHGQSHSPSVSGDGRRVAFLSSATDLTPGGSSPRPDPVTEAEGGALGSGPDHAYVRDLSGAGTALVGSTRDRAPGDGQSSAVTISSWGRHVAFADSSTNISGQDIEDGEPHVYSASVRTTRLPAPNPQNSRRGPDTAKPDPGSGDRS